MRTAAARVGCVAALALAALATPGAALGATVATTGGVGTMVRAHGDTIVFSEYDRTAARWYLNVRQVGARQRRVAVAPSRMPFDADIGTDGKGRPELIYQRCELTEPIPPASAGRRIGCDLYVFSLADGTGERPVRNANDGSRNDVNGTLWRGRIAWTREYGTEKDPDPVVYTKLLTAPRSQPSTRLPGVPTRRCAADIGIVEPPCGSTRDRWVGALELRGDDLGLIVGYVFDGLGGDGQSEVRLDSVSHRSARQVAFLVSGLNAQRFAGPSLFDGRIAWYKACGVSEASCRTAVGPWRYRLSTGAYERGAPGPILVRGFADTGSRLYEVACASGQWIYAPEPPTPTACPVESVAPPAYVVVPPPELASAKAPSA
jgi:hypothetical protein